MSTSMTASTPSVAPTVTSKRNRAPSTPQPQPLSEAEVEESLRHLLKATLSTLATDKMTLKEARDSLRAVCVGLASTTNVIPATLRADVWLVLLQIDVHHRTTLLCEQSPIEPITAGS